MTIAACAEIVRNGDPDRFLATMAAPVSARERLFPLYAFNVEVARAPWVTSEPMIAEMRLQWWRDVLDEVAKGEPARKHEVATPLSEVLSPELAEGLQSMVDARAWDVEGKAFADLSALTHHIENTSVVMAMTAANLLGGGVEAAKDLGLAQGIAAWLRAVPTLIAAGKSPLPGQPHETIRDLAGQGLERYYASRKHAVPAEARPALLVGFDAPLVLKAALSKPDLVLAGLAQPSEFRRRLRLMRLAALKRW